MNQLKRPLTVDIAVKILNFSLLFIFAIGLLSIINSQDYRALTSLNVGNGVYASVLLIGIFLLWLLFYLISVGMNFARYTLLFLYLIDALSWLFKFYGHAAVYKEVGFVLAVVELTLGLIALILLFLPSSKPWFVKS